jgi:hypothetical protein
MPDETQHEGPLRGVPGGINGKRGEQKRVRSCHSVSFFRVEKSGRETGNNILQALSKILTIHASEAYNLQNGENVEGAFFRRSSL